MRIVSQIISALFYGLLSTIALAQPVITPPPVLGNPTLGTLPSYNDASANWKNVGLLSVGGIPNRSTQCGATVTPSGLTPPVANDDAAKINAAITACTGGVGLAGQVVLLSSGTFVFDNTETIFHNNSVTLRGSGVCNNGSTPRCQTVLRVFNGQLPWSGGLCGIGPIAAAASWTTSSTTITMSANNAAAGSAVGNVTAGMPVYDWSSGNTIGTVSSWSTASTSLVLTAAATSASLSSSDKLMFTVACSNNAGGFIYMAPSGAFNAAAWDGAKQSSAIGKGTPLDADAAKGDTTIRVHSLTNFNVGDWVMLDEASGASYQTDSMTGNPYGNIWVSPDHYNTSGSPATGRIQWAKFAVQAFACPGTGAVVNGEFCTNDYPYNGGGTHEGNWDRATSEIHVIQSKGVGTCPGVNCTITFDTPLMIAYRMNGNTTFTGSISNGSGAAGTTLATTGDSCVTSVGQIVDDSAHVTSDGTYVTAVNSCSGGVGNYTVSISQLVTSRTLIGGAHQAHVYHSTGSGSPLPFLQYAGLENLTIQRANSAAVVMNFCAYCWVGKNVEITGWRGGAVVLSGSARSQVDTIYSEAGYSENDGSEYPVGFNNGTSESYLVNSIGVFAGKGMVGKAGGGNVVAYNYVDKTLYEALLGTTADWFVDVGVNGSHWAGTHHFLFEGNWGDNCDNDNTHGNAVYHTFFRNWCTGLRTAFTDPSIPPTIIASPIVDDSMGLGYQCPGGLTGCIPNAPGYLRAGGAMNHVYWSAFVGNVMGTPITTVANGWHYSGDTSQAKNIWLLGWNNDSNNQTKTDNNLNGTNSPRFLHRHGNYDYVTPGIADWNSSFSRGLPNSYYLGIRPAFFIGASCTYPWPPVTPTGASPLPSPTGPGACTTLSAFPAKARYDAGTPFVQQ